MVEDAFTNEHSTNSVAAGGYFIASREFRSNHLSCRLESRMSVLSEEAGTNFGGRQQLTNRLSVDRCT